jgi:hypothetical protein
MTELSGKIAYADQTMLNRIEYNSPKRTLRNKALETKGINIT